MAKLIEVLPRAETRKVAPVPGKARNGKPSLAAPRLKPKLATELTPLGAALRTFHRLSESLGLVTEDKLKLLNLGRTKYFECLRQPDPNLGVDGQDRLGYFLVIVELAGDLVGDAGAWLRAANRAPMFAGKPPLDRLLQGRMEDLFATLNYLRGSYGGWA